MQTDERSDNRPTLPAGLMLAGGLLLLVSSFLPWFVIGSPGQEDANIAGTDISVGLAALLFGLITLIAGAVMWFRGARTGGRGSSITAIVLSTFALLGALYSALAPGDALAQFAAQDVGEVRGVSEEVARQAIEAAIAQGSLTVDAALGTWLAVLGSLLGIAGGIAGVMYSRDRRKQRAVPPGEQPVAPPAEQPTVTGPAYPSDELTSPATPQQTTAPLPPQGTGHAPGSPPPPGEERR